MKVYQWDNSYQCEIHGYYLNDSTTPCAEILSVIGAPQQEIPQFELFEQKLSLPAEVAAKIHRENARRVLGLKQ